MSADPSACESKPSDASPPEAKASTPETTQPESTSSFGGWFSSMVQTAVSKSSGTLENIKRDLSEFKDAVQNDATSMVYSTASIVKNKLEEIGNTVNEIGSLGTNEEGDEPSNEELEGDIVKDQEREESSSNDDDKTTSHHMFEQSPFNMETINTWTNLLTDRAKTTINMVKDTLVESMFINRDFATNFEEEPYVIRNGQVVPIKNWKELLHNLQINPDTYCREPSGDPEAFELWLTKFNLINYKDQMEHLLDTVPEVLKLHLNLVPNELSDSDFWHRYYYKVHQLIEEQKQLILSSDDSLTSTATTNKQAVNESNSVNIKYLSEKSNEASQADTESKVSRSSTEDWEKMTDSEQRTPKEADKSSSGDEDRDWVKCD